MMNMAWVILLMSWKKIYLTDNNEQGEIRITPKTERGIRRSSAEEIFGKLKKQSRVTTTVLNPDEVMNWTLIPGSFSLVICSNKLILQKASVMHKSIMGLISFGCGRWIGIRETDFKAQTSTVLMIDISHSMILYGEDGITPLRKLQWRWGELIKTRYPKDTLDIVVFGNDLMADWSKRPSLFTSGALSYQRCCRFGNWLHGYFTSP